MAKDPAFLFYYQDFLVGTEFMSNKEVGCYIRILSHMADKGRLTEDYVKAICRGDELSEKIREKFPVDKTGKFFNKRLEKEVEKRRLYSLSRSLNRRYKKKTCKTYDQHMENENENENIYINKEKESVREKEKEFEVFWNEYPKKIGKKYALVCWKKVNPTNGMFEKIIQAVKNQKTWPQWNRDDGQYIPNPSTWLNQGRWDDVYEDRRCKKCNDRGKFVTATGYEQVCTCLAGKGKT